MSEATTPIASRFRLWFSGLRSRPDPGVRRLDTAIHDYRRELASRALLPGAEPARDKALGFVEHAKSFAKPESVETGWTILHVAQRTAIASYTDEDLDALATSLRNECEEKLRGWRRAATSEQLGKAGVRPRRQDVQEALKILHEQSDNTYHKLSLVREQLRLLLPTLLAALLVLVGIVVYGKYDIGLLQPGDLLMVMLLGALGGALSAVRATTNSSEGRIPDRLFASPITFLRPIVGATAATGVALLLQAGVGKLGDGSKMALFAAAFVAGFSERWFLSLVETATRGGKEK